MNKNKTTSNLNNEMKGVIVESIHEALSDPEYGIDLQEWVKDRLEKYSKEKDFTKFTPAEDLN